MKKTVENIRKKLEQGFNIKAEFNYRDDAHITVIDGKYEYYVGTISKSTLYKLLKQYNITIH